MHLEPLAVLRVVAGGGDAVLADPRRQQERLELLLHRLVPAGGRRLCFLGPLLDAVEAAVDALDALLHGAQELAERLLVGRIGVSSGSFGRSRLEGSGLRLGEDEV